MNAHLHVLQAEHEGSSIEDMAENMKKEYDSPKQSLEFCTQASERATKSRINQFEYVTLDEDGHHPSSPHSET